MENKERLIELHDEFVSIMKEYRKSKDKKNETMAYFRAVNDNLYTLKKKL